MELKKEVEIVWKKYEDYKENAEQNMFAQLYLYDMFLEPHYKDLQENWSDEHAETFIRGMKNVVFKKLGIAA